MVASLEEVLNGRIEFSKIHLKPFSALVLNDVAIIDNEPVTDWNGEQADTVAKARSIVTTFSLKGLRNDGTIHIRRLNVNDGLFVLAKDERGGSIRTPFQQVRRKRKKGTTLNLALTRTGSESRNSGSGLSTRPKTVPAQGIWHRLEEP